MGIIELRHLGILFFVLGIIIVGCSVRYFETTDGKTYLGHITHRLWMGYRVRIVRRMFWTGLILMALGSVLQW